MSDTQNTNNPDENIGEIPQSPLMIHRQYLKDLSFENPNAPEVLVRAETPPEMDMNLMLDVAKLEHDKIDHFYEVTIHLTANAKRNDKTLFIIEILYGTTVSIQELPENKHHPLLFIEVPQLMFPQVRQIVLNLTQNGSFTPLNLSPVDFRRMYLARFAKKAGEAETDKE